MPSLDAYLNAHEYLLEHISAPAFDPAPWLELLRFRPPADVLSKLPRGWRLQDVREALGPLNLDYYPVRIDKMPTVQGAVASGATLLEYVRRNLNSFISTALAIFKPYDESQAALWNSAHPVGAVLSIDLALPDNGSVLVGRASAQGWTFCTVKTENDGLHPVSGNREFGWREQNGSTILYTRGADRTTALMETAAFPIGFMLADRLWAGFQQRVVSFVTANGGNADAVPETQETLLTFQDLLR